MNKLLRRLKRRLNLVLTPRGQTNDLARPLATQLVVVASQLDPNPLPPLRKAMAQGDFHGVVDGCNAALPCRSKVRALRLLSLRARAELALGDHDAVMRTAAVLIADHNSAMGDYMMGKSHLARGQANEAVASLTRAVTYSKTTWEPALLLATVYTRLGQYENAWQIVESLVTTKVSARVWQIAGTLVKSQGDLSRLVMLFERWRNRSSANALSFDATMYVATGASNVRDYRMIDRIVWRYLMSAAQQKNGFGPPNSKKVRYSSNCAEVALIDLNTHCSALGLDMFLISGTLLGCIRENRLLGHDKDIDVGIWSESDPNAVSRLVNESGLFFQLHSRSPEIVRLRHVNGTAIDLFLHKRSATDFTHQGIKMVWHNAPFTLARHDFLGSAFLVPENYDLYLTENYGDWRTPKLAFDSVYDTPNGEGLDTNELALHAMRCLGESCTARNWKSAAFYLEKLDEYGHSERVAKMRSLLGRRLAVAAAAPETTYSGQSVAA